MNRRSFLAALAAGFAMDPERVLWVPGQKLISIPREQAVSSQEWGFIHDNNLNMWVNSFYRIVPGFPPRSDPSPLIRMRA